MPIDYELVQNKITDPPSFTPIVRHKGTVKLEQLMADIADASTLSPADIQATVTALIERIQVELERGNLVNIDGLASFSLSIKAQTAGPQDDLPANARICVNVKASRALAKAVAESSAANRVDARNQAPILLDVHAGTGSLSALASKDVIRISGSQLHFNVDRLDEGVYLAPVDDGPAVRVETYIVHTRNRIVFVVPIGISGVEHQYRLEVRSRGRTTDQLRTSFWPTLLGTP